MKQGATEYTELIMQKLRDHEFSEELMRVYFNSMDMNGELLLTYKTEFITNCCEQILGGALDAQGKSIVDLLILSGFIHKFSTLL